MLLHLSIRDFAIVDSLGLEFKGGFTALTGETGAGKSILIDALALALGERADASQVRAGCERCDIAAEFEIGADVETQRLVREQALDGDEGRLLLRRMVDRAGRSRGFVNGHAATLGQLREIGERLVDLHGQHAHQSLLRPAAQREILDAHAGLMSLARDCGSAYREWARLARARREFETNAAARSTERERLAWQAEELARLNVAPDEWEQIQSEHTRLAHAASLIDGVRTAMDGLSESDQAVLAGLSAVISHLRPLVGFDPTLTESLALLDSAHVQLLECSYALRHYAERIELDPARLRAVEERLEAIHGAARKFKTRPEGLAAMLLELDSRLKELEVASDLEALARQERAALQHYQDLAQRLTAERRTAAAGLARKVTTAIKELAMPHGRFEVELHPVAEGSAGGDETIEFLVAANPGNDPRPLVKVASGGELSRISLAIQVITSKAAAVPTLIFDEVDAGIGGAVAEIVGRKLRDLGVGRQVLCVTHLPQVAAQASEQWSVSKSTARNARKDEPITSRVRVLGSNERVEEIARMLGGMEITATTRKHAAEMLGLR